jgi:hypothetical protein
MLTQNGKKNYCDNLKHKKYEKSDAYDKAYEKFESLLLYKAKGVKNFLNTIIFEKFQDKLNKVYEMIDNYVGAINEIAFIVLDIIAKEFSEELTDKDVKLLKDEEHDLGDRMVDSLIGGGTLLVSYYCGQELLQSNNSANQIKTDDH